MLMYRRVTGKEELKKFDNCHIPDYLKEEIQAEKEKMIAE